MNFDEIIEFGKDQKKLAKKYRSLPEDLEEVKKILSIRPDAKPPYSHKSDKQMEDRARILKYFK